MIASPERVSIWSGKADSSSINCRSPGPPRGVGRWTKDIDYGEGSASNAGFPPMPDWFRDNRDFGAIASGLAARGFAADEINGIMGENWLAFFDSSFGPVND